MAGASRVGRLVLYHHDPQRDDDGVDDLLRRARALAVAEGLSSTSMPPRRVPCSRFADVDRPRGRPAGASATVVPAIDDLAVGVAIATSDPELEAAVEAAAIAEGLSVRTLAGDLSDAVVVMDRRRRRCITFGSTAALACSASPGGPSRRFRSRASLTGSCCPRRSPTSERSSGPPCSGRACRWLAAPVAPDEERRLATLHGLGLLDTPREERFDRLVEQAREIAATPIALVSLVDAQRQWFKATAGFDAIESHRDQSFCAHAILGSDVLQVPDALEDPRFADNPVVAGPIRVRFYAGVPLALADGSRVGTLVRRRSPPPPARRSASSRRSAVSLTLSSRSCKRRPDPVSDFLAFVLPEPRRPVRSRRRSTARARPGPVRSRGPCPSSGRGTRSRHRRELRSHRRCGARPIRRLRGATGHRATRCCGSSGAGRPEGASSGDGDC